MAKARRIMRVRISSRARGDVIEILGYIDTKSTRGAIVVKKAICAAIRRIGDFPNGGRPLKRDHTIQSIPVNHYPYLLYWTIESKEAWILHVRHAKRQAWDGKSAL